MTDDNIFLKSFEESKKDLEKDECVPTNRRRCNARIIESRPTPVMPNVNRDAPDIRPTQEVMQRLIEKWAPLLEAISQEHDEQTAQMLENQSLFLEQRSTQDQLEQYARQIGMTPQDLPEENNE